MFLFTDLVKAFSRTESFFDTVSKTLMASVDEAVHTNDVQYNIVLVVLEEKAHDCRYLNL